MGELSSIFPQMLRSLLWALVASVSFAFSMGLAIKVFDFLSKDIELENGKVIPWKDVRLDEYGIPILEDE